MTRTERAHQARRELDRKFAATDLVAIKARPRSGWVRAIRKALGMSQQALADRLDVSGPAVAKLEKAELDGGVTLAKLAEVARALDCTLVYALVPNSNLDEAVESQAQRVAAETLGYVGTTMGLEDQAVESDRFADQLEAETQRVIAANRQWRHT
jgi:predicted DNA-binding mobile mystery protein A